MKIQTLIITLFLLPPVASGQTNLVPNGNFEQHTDKSFPCSWLVDDGDINDYVYDWFTPIATTTDIMSSYAEVGCWAHTPETEEGYMAPHSGEVMIGFINYSPDGGCQPNEWHEYLSVELSEDLVPGNMYCLEFYVALGANSYYATNNIGALFTINSPERASCEPIFYKPQVNVERVINNTDTWLRIEYSFIADSTYRFLTIGNFYTHDNTIIEEQKDKPVLKPEGTPMIDEEAPALGNFDDIETGGISYLAYYFIDDVSLVLCPSVQKNNNEKPQGTN